MQLLVCFIYKTLNIFYTFSSVSIVDFEQVNISSILPTKLEDCTQRHGLWILTHFSPVSHFYTPRKRQKTFGFLTFSGGIEM